MQLGLYAGVACPNKSTHPNTNTHTHLLHDVEGRGLGHTDHLHEGPRHVLAGVAVVVEQQDLELNIKIKQVHHAQQTLK